MPKRVIKLSVRRWNLSYRPPNNFVERLEKAFPHRGFRCMMNVSDKPGYWEIVWDAGKPSIYTAKTKGEDVTVADEEARYLHMFTVENPDGGKCEPGDRVLGLMRSRDLRHKRAKEISREHKESADRKAASKERGFAGEEEDFARDQARPFLEACGSVSKYVQGESLTGGEA